ncbi:MAG: hypothetical protein HC887_04630 [Desulfobacteraceae bacterium]|nr:hypothetical protein [Desulfobacteraceae bacterium]
MADRPKDGRVRFQIDIFRYWIAYHFQTLEDLELKNDYHLYPEKKPLAWKFLLLSSAGLALVLAIIFFAGKIFISQPHTDIRKGDCIQLKKGDRKTQRH